MPNSIPAPAASPPRPLRRADLGEFARRVRHGADVRGVVAVLDGGADVGDGLVQVVDRLVDVGVVGLVADLVEVLVYGGERLVELGRVVRGVFHGLLEVGDAVGDG